MPVADRSELPLHALTAVSAIDGRYARHTAVLRNIVSEYGLIRYRVLVEVEWLKSLAAEPAISGLSALDESALATLDTLVSDFDLADAERVKAIEGETNHDVKAVEYFLREKLQSTLPGTLPYIHFGCTSEDINNLSYSLMLTDARDVLAPVLTALVDVLRNLAYEHADCAMLARTHGQNATPTTMGKEIANVVHRLEMELEQFSNVSLRGKMNGAVGNYNAHVVAFPDIDWPRLNADFVERLGLTFNPYTTQIEPHDCIAAYAHTLVRMNTILVDLCRDIWQYISLGYFRQRQVAGEVGSSTMPHKVNPIDFENAEGNLGLATALFEHFAHKLPISRLQRDLTDSTVLRNIGAGLAHVLIACRSLDKGLGKLELNSAALDADLDQAWEILAEPVQTVMRAEGIVDSYEQLKALTRGQAIDRETLHRFIDDLSVSDSAKQRLKALTPASYTGLAQSLARDV